MGSGIAATIIGVLLTNTLQEVVKRINNEKVTTNVKPIKDCINRVNCEVENYEDSPKDKSVAWRDKIAKWRRLLWNIEDCIDKFKIKKLTAEQFAKEIERIETPLKEQCEDISAYINAQKEAALKNQGSIQAHQGSSQGQHDIPNHADLAPVGIEEALEDLLALVRPSNNQQAEDNPKVMKVICIVGFGGVGKTCLAAEVYSHADVGKSFQLRAFVRATGMHKEGVPREVLRQLCKDVPSGSADDVKAGDELIEHWRKNLRSTNNRCFIVVDDVHDLELGSGVIKEFREKTRVDGIIIMTTTVQNFAESWSCHVYKMRPLSVELSGTLFLRTLLEDGGHCPDVDVPKSEEAGKECDGVPLAVITWAKYWKQDTRRCKTVWSKVGDGDWCHKLQDMAQVLEHSYECLPTIDQQTCLLYFSLFRREHTIKRGSLIRRWQAEGSEVGCGNLTNNHIPASQNWKMLVDRNVVCPIQVSINEDQRAKTCRPSGAMLAYISHKSRPEGFARECSDEACPSQYIRRLSLQTNNSEVLKDEGAVSCLRTLVVSPDENNKTKAADLSFDKCELLRVLDLEACSGPERISIVEKVCKKLKLLKYLSLRSEFIGYVPQEIKQLQMLETLDVGEEKVVLVHVDVLLLPKLKHLIGKFKLQTSWEFYCKKEKFKAKQLETLRFVTLHGKGFPKLMKNMSKLRKVKIFFDPKASAKSLSNRLADAITAFLRESANHLYVGERRTLSFDIPECNQPASEVLRSLDNAEGKLYSLKLCGTSDLKSFPSFICKLKGIEKLCISFHTLSWQAIIDGQNGLPDLKYLKLVAKNSFIGVSEESIAGQSRVTNVLLIKGYQFKNLERMCLQSAQILPKIEIQGEALTKLVSLHLMSGDGIGKPNAVICNSNSANQNQNEDADKIPPLKNLKEVALQSSSPVIHNIKKAWHEAARGHPKSPQVLFIEDPHNA